MHSFTSSSEARFCAVLALTFGLLVGGWEAMLRARAGATVRLAFDRPEPTAESRGATKDEWLLFGNCLVMTGVSPKTLGEVLPEAAAASVVNIATHEQSPLAYFDYLLRSGHYPKVAVANVSSWLNGTNFDQEAAAVAKADPLHLDTARQGAETEKPAATASQAFRGNDEIESGRFQRDAEANVATWASARVRTLGRRYHLFDYVFFTKTLLTTLNLDEALYQLNMQSWFQVTGSTTDGHGFLGLHVRYRDDWDRGLERMAERSLQRMELSSLLTTEYWARLEAGARDLRAHGTRVVFVRMPEHPRIRAFNDRRYDVRGRLDAVARSTGAEVVDLSALGPKEGVRLFDGIHPDAEGAEVITRELAARLAKAPRSALP